MTSENGITADMDCVLTRQLAVLAIAVAVISGCESVDRAALPMSLTLPPIGEEFHNEILVGDKKVPLPDGRWTVIGTEIAKNGARGYFISEILVQTKDKTVVKAVEIFTNLPVKRRNPDGVLWSDLSGPRGWLTHRSCTRDDMHFLKVYSNIRLGEQDCWWVNHWRMHRTGATATEHWLEAGKYLVDNDISAPLDMLAVSYRLADETNYLTVNYFFNPEVEGVKSTNDTRWNVATWETSDWRPEEVKKDEKRRKYVQKLVAWGERWHERIRRSFGLE